MKEQILIVEDEQAIAAFVQTSLEREGFAVRWPVPARLRWHASGTASIRPNSSSWI